MSSRVVFALTEAQARCLDQVTRPAFRRDDYPRELVSLERRYLVQRVARGWKLTAWGCIAQELVRAMELQREGGGQG